MNDGHSSTLRDLLYGQASVDDWAAGSAAETNEEWRFFEDARSRLHAGHQDQAVDVWRSIVESQSVSSRQALQAWHFMRQAGYSPQPRDARVALGAVAEVPMEGSHDILAAYQDLTADYVNYSGRTAERRSDVTQPMKDAINNWLAAAQAIANATGPWTANTLPPLPPGHARVAALTANGPHFGQGPAEELMADPGASTFFRAATRVMRLITGIPGAD